MPTVYATGNGAIRARIVESGGGLSLFRTGERNRIIRDALVSAGNQWLVKFRPTRFTSYVQRAPFGYPKRPTKLAIKKLRTAPGLSQIWNGIVSSRFSGWDPFDDTANRIPDALFRKWLAMNPGRYAKGRFGGGNVSMSAAKQAREDIRAWARKIAREHAANLAEDGKILPLVWSGDLRAEKFGKSHARATATQKMARLTITLPRGDRQSATVARIMGTLPIWEFNEIVKWFGVALTAGIKTGLTPRIIASTGGRSVGAGATRSVGAGKSRGAA